MKEKINNLYDYLDKCDDILKLEDKQCINLKILEIAHDYLSVFNNNDIYELYNKVKDYWTNPLGKNNLNELKNLSLDLSDRLFKIKLNSIESITLRLISSVTYDDEDKDDFKQSFEFYEYLIDLANELGY